MISKHFGNRHSGVSGEFNSPLELNPTLSVTVPKTQWKREQNVQIKRCSQTHNPTYRVTSHLVLSIIFQFSRTQSR